MSAIIYKYFEEGKLIPNENNPINYDNYTYVCKWCKEKNYKNTEGEICTVNAKKGITSNLIKHLNRKNHEEIRIKYEKEADDAKNLTETPPRKRSRVEAFCTPSRTLTNMGAVPYPRNSIVQMDRYKALVRMLIKLMLPISIVEKDAFKEFIKIFDPHFTVPNRLSIKTIGVEELYKATNIKIKEILDKCQWINLSNDGWSDATARCFNGYVAQTIDDNWNLLSIPIAFRETTGSHDSYSIKHQFDQICNEFAIGNKLYKILADQAAPNVKAFKNITDSDPIINQTVQLILNQRAIDRKEKRKKDEEEKLKKAPEKYQNEIEKMNATLLIDKEPVNKQVEKQTEKPKSREQVILDFEEEYSFDDQTSELLSDDEEEEIIDEVEENIGNYYIYLFYKLDKC